MAEKCNELNRSQERFFYFFVKIGFIISLGSFKAFGIGRKSNKKIKYLFYVFYPLHLVVLLCLTFVI